ncbi:MAG: PEGA domain-containing protein [Polyangiaceae bacterium]|nr:PEGA domain-containing protein [Polyangiaceae bacterium]
MWRPLASIFGPRERAAFLAILAALLVSAFGSRQANAAEPDHAQLAREAYVRGSELAKEEKWGEALAAFERSNENRSHALTLYNLGVCERVLGLATRARARFRDTLQRATEHSDELPAALAESVKGYLTEYARTLPQVTLTVAPVDAAIAIDGRPLRTIATTPSVVLEANTMPAGVAARPPAATFVVEMDPGSHVITLVHQGFADVAVRRSFPEGYRGALTLAMDSLPATVNVASNVNQAIVRVNGVDVGMAPVDISRPPGHYRVDVFREGFVPVHNEMDLRPGAAFQLRAKLEVERVPLYKKWWFWTGAAAIVATGVLVTYAATRPTPEPPPYDAGSTGWLAGTR